MTLAKKLAQAKAVTLKAHAHWITLSSAERSRYRKQARRFRKAGEDVEHDAERAILTAYLERG